MACDSVGDGEVKVALGNGRRLEIQAATYKSHDAHCASEPAGLSIGLWGGGRGHIPAKTWGA